MNTEHLRYFLTVVQCGSIGKAGEQLQLKQQYLSSVIKSLEQQLGTRLFDRHTRGVTLTADGEYLRDKISQIVALTNEIQLDYLYPSKSIYKDAINDINIYTLPQLRAAALNDILAEYRQHFPNVAVRIVEKKRAELLKAVVDNREALGITMLEYAVEDYQKTLPKGLRAIYYRSAEMVAIAAQNNPAARDRQNMTQKELLAEELIAYAPEGVEFSTVYRLLKPFGEPKIKYVVESSALFLSLLQSGQYFSIGARDSARDEGLKQIPFKEPLIYDLIFVLHEETLKSFSVRSFINLLLTRSGQPVLENK